jgi:hypothetical protein
MIIALPLSSDPAQSFITQLGNEKYQFDVRWNDRSGVWTMDLTRDSDQAILLQGIPLVLGCDILSSYTLGIGRMLVVDETGTHTDASYNDLGSRVKVYWFSPDEVLP